MARIVMQLPGGQVQEHPLSRSVRVGRHPEQDIQILDPLVSKAHIVVERIADDWYIRDLDSRNGTWLNGDRVYGRTALTNHDRIKIGTTQLVFTTREEARSLRPSGQVRLGGPTSVELDVARLREVASDYLPADLVADSSILARDYERLRLARLLSRHFNAQTRLDVLLPSFIEHLFTVFNGDRGAVLLISETGELVPRAVAARGIEPTDEAIQLSHGLLTAVMDSRSAVLSRDARTEGPAMAPGEAQGNKRSSMCAPLIGRQNTVLGIIHLESISVANAFSDRDLGSFFALAEVAAEAIEDTRHIARLEKDAAQRAELTRLVSGATTDRILRGELQIQDEAAQRDVTVLWLDLRDIICSYDRDAPAVFAEQLLHRLVDIVNSLDGTIERAGGDAVVAVWGAPIAMSNGPARAQRCAAALSQAIKEYNNFREDRGGAVVRFGIGITCGRAVAGVTKWPGGGRFTVIGAPMNTAGHLAGIADHGEILTTEAIRRTCPPAFLRSHHAALSPEVLSWLDDPMVVWVASSEALGPRDTSENITLTSADGVSTMPAKRDTF